MFELFGILGMALLGTAVVLLGFWCGWKLVDLIWKIS